MHTDLMSVFRGDTCPGFEGLRDAQVVAGDPHSLIPDTSLEDTLLNAAGNQKPIGSSSCLWSIEEACYIRI